jgi:phospholipase/carboxylesterase
MIEAFIAREAERGIPASRVVLAGFSQGGVMSLHVGLRYPKKLAGMMVLSGYLPLAQRVAKERSAENGSAPIFMGHGREDPVIPIAAAKSSRLHLVKFGYRIEWHEYRMQHTVCDQEIAHIGAWLTKVLL